MCVCVCVYTKFTQLIHLTTKFLFFYSCKYILSNVLFDW